MAKPIGRRDNISTPLDTDEIHVIPRNEFHDLFNETLNNVHNNDYNLLHFHGIGGIGKSTLKTALYNKTHTKPYATTISIDLSYNKKSITVNKFFEEIQRFLEKKYKPIYFALAYKIYFQKQNPKTLMQSAKLPFFEESSFIAEIFENSTMMKAIALGQNIVKHANRQFVLDKKYVEKLNQLNEKSIEDIERELPYFIGKDIEVCLKNEIKTGHRFIFFFDTYEVVKTGGQFEEIIHGLINETQGLNCMFVSFGREQLVWEKDWDNILVQQNIQGFTENESKKFLIDNGIRNLEIINLVVRNSGGVPLYLQAALKIYKDIINNGLVPDINDFQATVGKQILKQMIKYANESDKLLYRVLSLVNSFDYALFSYIRREFSTSFDFLKLKQDSFIEKKEDGHYALHGLMKDVIIPTIDPEEKEGIHQKLYEYFITIFEENLPKISTNSIDNIIEHGINYNSHKLFTWFKSKEILIDSISTQKDIIPSYTNFANGLHTQDDCLYIKFKLLKIYYNLMMLKEADDLLEDIKNNNTLTSQNLIHTKYYRALLLNKSRDKKSKSTVIIYFEEVYKNIDDIDIRLNSLWKLLKLYKQNKFLQEVYFNKILVEIKNLNNDPLKIAVNQISIGKYYTFHKQFELAEKAFNIAEETFHKFLPKVHPSFANLYLAYSYLYENISDSFYDKAINYLLQALKIYEEVYMHHEDITICYRKLSSWYIEGHTHFYNDINIYKLRYQIIFTYIETKDYPFEEIINEIEVLSNLSDEISNDKKHSNYIRFGIFYGKRKQKKEAEKLFYLAFNSGEISEKQRLETYSSLFYYYKSIEDVYSAEFYLLEKLEIIKEKEELRSLLNAYRELCIFFNKIGNFAENLRILEIRNSYISSLSLLDKATLHNDFVQYYSKSYRFIDLDQRENHQKQRIFHLRSQCEIFITEKFYNPDELERLYTYLASLDKEMSENYFLKIIKLWENNLLYLSKLDMSYAKIIKFYENKNSQNLMKAEYYYLKQIDVRKLAKNVEKLARAYHYYGVFLEKRLHEIPKASDYYNLELNTYKENNDNEKYNKEIINTLLNMSKFYSKNFSSSSVELICLSALTFAKSMDQLETYCTVIEHIIRSTKDIFDTETILLETKELLLEKNQYLLYINKIYPLLSNYFNKYRCLAKSKNLDDEMKLIYETNELADLFSKQLKNEIALYKKEYDAIDNYEKRDIVSLLQKISKNIMHIFQIVGDIKNTLLFSEIFSKIWKDINHPDNLEYILNIWIDIVESNSLNKTDQCYEYNKIAIILNNIDNEKSLYFVDKYIQLAMLLKFDDIVIYKKCNSLLAKVKKMNNEKWIKKINIYLEDLNYLDE